MSAKGFAKFLDALVKKNPGVELKVVLQKHLIQSMAHFTGFADSQISNLCILAKAIEDIENDPTTVDAIMEFVKENLPKEPEKPVCPHLEACGGQCWEYDTPDHKANIDACRASYEKHASRCN